MNEDNGSRYIQPHDSLEAMELAYRAIRENQGFLLCLTTQPL